jgi:hypothetical protein
MGAHLKEVLNAFVSYSDIIWSILGTSAN